MIQTRTMQMLACWSAFAVLFGGCIELSTTQGTTGSGGAGGGSVGSGGSGSGGETANCQDKIQNGSETDIDCGGSDCPRCDIAQRCSNASDCISDICLLGECVAPSCSDAMTNGNETDIDCGGSDCQPCASGQDCMIDADCASSACINNQCAAPIIIVGTTVIPAQGILVTISPPMGTAMGDLLVVFIAHGGGPMTVPTPMGWTEVENGSNPGQDPKLDVFYRQYDGSANYLFLKNSGDGSAILAAFRGAQFGVKDVPENDISVDITTNDVSTILFVSLTNTGGDIPAKPTDFTELALGNSNGRSIRVSHSAPKAAGMYTFAADISSGEDTPNGTFAMSLH